MRTGFICVIAIGIGFIIHGLDTIVTLLKIILTKI